MPPPDSVAPEPVPTTHSPYLPAHTAIAEALGYVAIECWVGPEWDSDDLVGPYTQMIADGWYTNVETSASGWHGVEQRFTDPSVAPEQITERYTWETFLEVSWRAEPGATFAECEVAPRRRATLRVTTVDARQRPLQGVDVYACGDRGTSDADGVVVLNVSADTRCGLSGSLHDAPPPDDMCEGELVTVPLAAGESGDATLMLRCGRFDHFPIGHFGPNDIRVHPPQEWGADLQVPTEEELRRFRELAARDFGREGNALIAHLVAHREEILADKTARARRDATAPP